MDASTVVAACATVIAVVSLVVSVSEARATRRHYLLSVRPLLELQTSFRRGDRAGLRLMNVGLGPAVITKTLLTVDDQLLGAFNEANVNKVRDSLGLRPRPAAVTFAATGFLATDFDRYLLSVDGYDPDLHATFIDLLSEGGRFSLDLARRGRAGQVCALGW